MIEKKVKIINNAGLHTRPAATIVKIAAKFKSEFFIHKDGMKPIRSGLHSNKKLKIKKALS